MIDIRHAYALAHKIGDRFFIATAKRGLSTQVVLGAHLEPIRRAKQEMDERDPNNGMVIIQIIDNRIVEVPASRESTVET